MARQVAFLTMRPIDTSYSSTDHNYWFRNCDYVACPIGAGFVVVGSGDQRIYLRCYLHAIDLIVKQEEYHRE